MVDLIDFSFIILALAIIGYILKDAFYFYRKFTTPYELQSGEERMFSFISLAMTNASEHASIPTTSSFVSWAYSFALPIPSVLQFHDFVFSPSFTNRTSIVLFARSIPTALFPASITHSSFVKYEGPKGLVRLGLHRSPIRGRAASTARRTLVFDGRIRINLLPRST